jgi:hypothetical protein
LQFRRGAESAEPQSGIQHHLWPFLEFCCFHPHKESHSVLGRLAQAQAGIFGGSRKIEVREKSPEHGIAGLIRPGVL